MGTASAFANAREALDMVRSGLRFLADADATELSCAEQAELLRDLERANSVATVIHGDLTPQCASLAGTVLDALGGLTGTGDGRSREQRYHDALQEAMRR
ncbi:MAG TPA: hypothetical protein VFV73_38310, partial [Streptosporangiaceae bacterium]|nr:hypothetical protein [Streptosporangiaceae bacterium]